MNLLIAFFALSFLLGLILWNRSQKWRKLVLIVLCVLLSYVYYAYLSHL